MLIFSSYSMIWQNVLGSDQCVKDFKGEKTKLSRIKRLQKPLRRQHAEYLPTTVNICIYQAYS